MILATIFGFGLERMAGIPDGLAYGLMLGIVTSLFIPTGACSIRR